MIQRTYPTILTAWHGMVDELVYKAQDPIKWGVCMSYPEIVECKIEDALLDEKLHLDMSSYTKMRWRKFLKRYFRPDLPDWIDRSVTKLKKYPNRPFVAGYSIQPNIEDSAGRVGHNYGGCLGSLQIRLKPRPTVILMSRACQMDKIGFLDFTLMHLVAKRVALSARGPVQATWVVSLPFISAISQVYYVKRFKKTLRGHALKRRVEQNSARTLEDVTYGPLKRLIKRNQQWAEHGKIAKSCPVSELELTY